MNHLLWKINKETWDLWSEILKKRATDDIEGNCTCEFCRSQINILSAEVGVYYKKSFPFWFHEKNNYICCSECKVPKEKIKEAKEYFGKTLVDYNKEDVLILRNRLRTILKNHSWKKKMNH